MKIKLLPESVYSKIAAGEVIDKPASIVRELIDNSIDAQATEIVISLKKGEEPLIFPNEVRTLINDCFLQLGKSYKDEQIKNLDYTIEQLKEEIEQEEKDFSQKIKVFRAIALFIGCSTVILLV